MGTCSYVLTGTEQGMTETFGTTCHGAVSRKPLALFQIMGFLLHTSVHLDNMLIKIKLQLFWQEERGHKSMIAVGSNEDAERLL